MRAWRDLPTLRDVDRFDAWLYRLLVRACTDAGRDRRRWQAGLVLMPREPAVGDASRALADRDQLDRGLQRLPTEQRTLLVLRYYVDLSVPEVADVLGVACGHGQVPLALCDGSPPGGSRCRCPDHRGDPGGPFGMNGYDDLEQRLARHLAEEPAHQAPDRVLLGALTTVKTTRQRRRWSAPWRTQPMFTFLRYALVTGLAAILFATVVVFPRSAGPGDGPGVIPVPGGISPRSPADVLRAARRHRRLAAVDLGRDRLLHQLPAGLDGDGDDDLERCRSQPARHGHRGRDGSRPVPVHRPERGLHGGPRAARPTDRPSING